MYPHERSLVAEMQGKPFALIGVNSDTDKQRLAERIAAEKITWRSFWNGPDGTNGPISTAWRVTGWPTTVLLRGKIMVADGQLLGSPTDGKLVTRKIDPRVLRRPAF